MPDIVTKPYKLTPGRIGRRGVDLWLGRWWWACALPLAPLLIGACFDLRLLITALALALIAYPAILMFAFYSYALSPDSSRLILPQTATFGPDTLTVSYLSLETEAPEPIVIPYSAITKFTDTGSALQISYTSPTPGWLEIPANALGAQYYEAISLLQR